MGKKIVKKSVKKALKKVNKKPSITGHVDYKVPVRSSKVDLSDHIFTKLDVKLYNKEGNHVVLTIDINDIIDLLDSMIPEKEVDYLFSKWLKKVVYKNNNF